MYFLAIGIEWPANENKYSILFERRGAYYDYNK